MSNSINLAKIYQSQLDTLAVVALKTGWMEMNAGQVRYNGGNEVKIPKMSVDGLADYSRENGYPAGAIAVSWETRTMTQDRGRQLTLDAQDVDETNFAASAASALSTFQNDHVIPEIDAYRLAAVYGVAKAAGHVQYYTPAASDILAKLKADIAKARENGAVNPVVHITYDALAKLETALASCIKNINWKQGGVDTQVPALDGCPLIETPAARMYQRVTISSSNGYTGVGAIHWIVVDLRAPVAISKTDKMKIWTPDQNQDADAYKINYRKYHDLWVMDNKVNLIYAAAAETYVAVTPETGDNPKTKGWYELSGSTYVLTTDTTVSAGKTYYELL
jgi:hypothetical protein